VGNNRRATIAAVAILLAVVAGVGAYIYLSGADQRAQKNYDLVDAFVAAGNIPKGTSGQQAVSGQLIVTKKVVRNSRPETALPGTSAIANQVAVTDINKGDFIFSNSFVDQAQSQPGLSDLAKGDVAVTVSVDDVRGVAGFVQPGDRVNVMRYASTKNPPGVQQGPDVGSYYTAYVAQNLRVLAVGHLAVNSVPTTTAPSGAPAAAAAPTGSVLITLEVSPLDAEKVVLAQQGSPTPPYPPSLVLALVPKGYQPAVVAPVTDAYNLNLPGVTPSRIVG